MDEPVIPVRLRSEVDAELADYGFRKRDLDRLIAREAEFLEQVDADLERYSTQHWDRFG
jgi:parvulin-like peptidyl-prolyl isomerase